MTANAAIASPAAAPAPTRAGVPADAREPVGHFGRQLDAARQQRAAETPAPAKPETTDHAAAGSAATKPVPEQTAADIDGVPAAATTAAAAPATAETVAALSAPSSAAAADDTATAKPVADAGTTDDQAAMALAAAMLTLLGPAATLMARPGAGAAAAAGGKAAAGTGAAGNGGINALLQTSAAASMAAVVADAGPTDLATLASLGGAALPRADAAQDSLTGLPQAVALPAPAPNTAAPALPLLQLSAPVGSEAFASELGQQVTWLGQQNIKQARIRLHPEDLGQLDVKISVTHDRVDVVFSAQHPAAVTAVQQSLPQLGQLLAQHGLTLGHTEVGQHDRGNQSGRHGEAPAELAADAIGEVHGAGLLSSTLGSVSLLDAFA